MQRMLILDPCAVGELDKPALMELLAVAMLKITEATTLFQERAGSNEFPEASANMALSRPIGQRNAVAPDAARLCALAP